MDTITLVTAVALMWKIVDFVKYLSNRDTNGIVTQLSTWVAGVVVLWVLALSDFAGGISVGSQTLDALNFASIVLLGMSLSSTGSVVYDYKKARDNSDTASTPPMTRTISTYVSEDTPPESLR